MLFLHIFLYSVMSPLGCIEPKGDIFLIAPPLFLTSVAPAEPLPFDDKREETTTT